MKSLFRATVPQDSPAVREFLASAFETSRDAPFLDPELMEWKYWKRRDDWADPRGYVLERDGAIMAHAGLWPVVFEGRDTLRGVQMMDWASAKDSPGAGLALVQKITGLFDFVYSIGGTDVTRKVLPAFGFVEARRQWKGVRPLRPLRQILTHQNRNWKIVPRLFRNVLWSASGRSLPLPWTFQRMEAGDVMPSLYSMGPDEAGASPRSPAFFEYLSRCPRAGVHLYRLMDRGESKGHFLLTVVRGQARLAGIWVTERTDPAWTTANVLAIQAARTIPGANELVTSGSMTQLENTDPRLAAGEAGFRTVPGAPVFLFDKKKRLNLAPDFQFQISDYDGCFFDSGSVEYWS